MPAERRCTVVFNHSVTFAFTRITYPRVVRTSRQAGASQEARYPRTDVALGGSLGHHRRARDYPTRAGEPLLGHSVHLYPDYWSTVLMTLVNSGGPPAHVGRKLPGAGRRCEKSSNAGLRLARPSSRTSLSEKGEHNEREDTAA